MSDEEVIEAFEATGSVWKAGDRLGISGQTVQRRLVALGYPRNGRQYNEEDLDAIRSAYANEPSRGDLQLEELASRLGRHKSSVCIQARKMGLTFAGRTITSDLHAGLERGKLARFEKVGHPRGFQDHKHTAEAKQKISKTSIESWSRMTDDERSAFVLKALKGKVKKYGSLASPRPHASWKAGWREIGGKRHYFRSKWEMNYARWLEFRKSILKEIAEWEYEPETFWFENIRRGTRSYTPDFKIQRHDGTSYFDEVKGWMDDRSITKLRRMAKYHPHVKVNVIDKHWFAAHKNLQSVIAGWEI